MGDVQVASDLLELADLCGWDKKQFADIADFILNRLLLVNESKGIQRLRSNEELRPYIFQLEQAGGCCNPCHVKMRIKPIYQIAVIHS